ncbi:hypothetical protein Bbelb_149910 [Branchiostoma belcheri]|nr:hypothetical protein Bbelb_149910 [Branchiostoma belcheri]
MTSPTKVNSVDRVELRRQAQLQRAGMKVSTEPPAVSKPLFDAPVKIEPPPDDHVYRKTQETLGQFSLIRHSMLSSHNQYLLGIPKGPQTPVLNKTADSVWASKFPANGQLPPSQKSAGSHRPKQSGRSSSSERSRGRGSKSPADRRGSEGRSSANHKSSSSSHGQKNADKSEERKRQEEPRSKESSEGSRPGRTAETGHERRKSSSKRPSVSPHRSKDGQGAASHSHSSKAAEPHSKPAHSRPEKSPPVQPDSSSVSVKMEASSTKDDAFQMPAPLSTAPGSHRPSHSGGKGADRAEERPNGLLAGASGGGGKKEGGERELSREDVKRKLRLTMPDTSEEARLNSSGGLKSAGTEKVEIILKEMTEVGPPLTGIHTPIKTDISKFPFPANQAQHTFHFSLLQSPEKVFRWLVIHGADDKRCVVPYTDNLVRRAPASCTLVRPSVRRQITPRAGSPAPGRGTKNRSGSRGRQASVTSIFPTLIYGLVSGRVSFKRLLPSSGRILIKKNDQSVRD